MNALNGITILLLLATVVGQAWLLRRYGRRLRFSARVERLQEDLLRRSARTERIYEERHALTLEVLRLTREQLVQVDYAARLMQHALNNRPKLPPPASGHEPYDDPDWWKKGGQ